MPDPFGKSPLFRLAPDQVRRSARSAFRRTAFGRMAVEAERIVTGTKRRPQIVEQALQKYRRFSPEAAMRELMRSDFGRLVRDVERYSRSRRIDQVALGRLLGGLGPAGQIIAALVSPPRGTRSGLNRDVQSAIDLVRAFGGEVLLPHQGRKPTTGAVARGVEAARQYLETLGYEVVSPEEVVRRGRKLSTETAPRGRKRPPVRPATPPDRVEVQLDGRTQRFPSNHPIVTGDMVAPGTSLGGGHHSSSVHSFGYDLQNRYLYVRFYADTKSDAAGPLYRYFDVSPAQFLSLLRAGSKGDWVWDHLRVRGSAAAHQKQYQLVGITRGYVPRKATLLKAGEFLVPRTVHVGGGRFVTSNRPYAKVSPFLRGLPNTGRPKPPNRGGP